MNVYTTIHQIALEREKKKKKKKKKKKSILHCRSGNFTSSNY